MSKKAPVSDLFGDVAREGEKNMQELVTLAEKMEAAGDKKMAAFYRAQAVHCETIVGQLRELESLAKGGGL